MADTSFFTQGKDCVYCVKELFGYCCDKNLHEIDNIEKDGCTWGKEKGERENE